ncbi:hypothetical protein HID58_096041 [Brassica napus]|uniref:Photosystem I assembly protein Ycf4 n=1 Tax=Brassica napus TaxID=3708 RepID=A0ABQ7X217_BRANA|nr:hypothetical protein HID58_096041 [Brassica napus]
MGFIGILIGGTSSYLGKKFISLVASQEILFFPQGILLFVVHYLWNVGSGYDLFDRKEGIVRIFRWDFLEKAVASFYDSL